MRPLEGESGFYRVFANGERDLQSLTRNLGDPYQVTQSWIKAFPMNGTLHSPIEGLLQVMQQNRLQHTDIEKISASWFKYKDFIAKKDVLTIVSAQASLPYAIAATAVRGKCTVEEFSDQALNDPIVRAMLHRVEVYDDPALYERAGRKSVPGRVTVQTKNGQTFTEEVTYPKGNPQNPMSEQELQDKFANLTHGVLSDASRAAIYQQIMDLDNASDLSGILALCAASELGGDITWNA